MPKSAALAHALAVIFAVGTFALASMSPVSHADSDAAVSLVGAQALVEHQTLKIDAYADDPRNAYDFVTDYRVRQRDGSFYSFIIGVPVLSAPFVWIANRFGHHMIEQGDEFALQNLLSAGVCAVLFLLLYRLGLYYVKPVESLLLSLVLTLGSPLISTLGTALWNQGYAMVGMLLMLLEVVRHERAGKRPRLLYLGVLTLLSFLCRPTVAFFFFGLLVWFGLLGWSAWRERVGGRQIFTPKLLAALAVLTLIAAFFSRWLLELEWLSNYYSPRRLWPPRTPLELGTLGSLFSPSRGMLIFSPFLFPILFGALVGWRRLVARPLFWLAAIWSFTHLIGVAIKGVWWGGFSYGPRMMAEAMLPAALLTFQVWEGLTVWTELSGTAGRALRATFFVLTLVALPINSYQGLFNLSTVRWNVVPNIDEHSEYVLSWRYPQFLASPEQIEKRYMEIQRGELEAYRPGQTIAARSKSLIFDGWWEPEATWRWSSREDPQLIFRPLEVETDSTYLLTWHGGAFGQQRATVWLNGHEIGRLELEGFEPRTHRFPFPGAVLQAGVENTLRFDVPQSHATEEGRTLGLTFHTLNIQPLRLNQRLITFRDDAFFLEGFSHAEAAWRWTDRPLARLLYPLPGQPATRYRASLTIRALEQQRVEIWVDGEKQKTLRVDGFEPQSFTFELDLGGESQSLVDQANLGPRNHLVIEFRLPDALTPPGDTRLLALGFVSFRLEPIE